MKPVLVLTAVAIVLYLIWPSDPKEKAEAERKANIIALENRCAEISRNTVGTADRDGGRRAGCACGLASVAKFPP